MLRGDLSNRPVPKDVLVWEGLLGLIPDPKVARQESRFRAKGKWAEAVACYEINELLARKVVDMVWRTGMDIELLTFHGREFAEALEERMDRESIPVSNVWSEDPDILARRLIRMPEIRTIYDPFPDHQFRFGGRGVILAPETAHHYLGAL